MTLDNEVICKTCIDNLIFDGDKCTRFTLSLETEAERVITISAATIGIMGSVILGINYSFGLHEIVSLLNNL